MKRMMHPSPLQWTHVYSPQEAEVLRKNGWVDDPEAAPAKPEPAAAAAEGAPPPEKKKPGPKPKA